MYNERDVMNVSIGKHIAWVMACGLMGNVVFAETAVIQLSLTPDIALQSTDTRIEGLSLNIWGENEQSALTIGLVNGARNDSQGLMLGYILNYADNYNGVQWGFVNYNKGDFLGWQSGFVNYTAGRFKGLQSGFINVTDTFSGLQLGVINMADEVESGVQIGLINVISENQDFFTNLPDELAPAMVFVNWHF